MPMMIYTLLPRDDDTPPLMPLLVKQRHITRKANILHALNTKSAIRRNFIKTFQSISASILTPLQFKTQ
jgi:hypothetical protein